MICEVYDIECLYNLFTYTGFCRETKQYYQFVIHDSINQYKELIAHLKRGKMVMVGYNNENYDYPMIHHLLNHCNEYQYYDPGTLARKLYEKSQSLISQEFSAIADRNKFIRQIDLFLIWHYNNLARSTSLKDLEVAMRLDNVEDMPIHHSKIITSNDEIDMVLQYNKHDVNVTNIFLDVTLGKTDFPQYKNKDKLKLRKGIAKQHNIPCLNYPDVKIGEQLLLNLYCKATGLARKYVSKLGTKRDMIFLNECVLDSFDFQTNEFQALHKWFKKQVLTTTKDAFSGIHVDKVSEILPYVHPESIKVPTKKNPYKSLSNINIYYNGIRIDYGLGGLHGSKTGIFESDDTYMIIDSDVASMYPSVGIQNEFYPEHLGPQFYKIMDKDIIQVRFTEKAKEFANQDQTIIEGMKLSANGAYGKSNEEKSFIYDPAYTMKITINSQLFLTKLIESLSIAICDLNIISCNTDGATFKIKKTDYHKYLEICSKWESSTGLKLEHAEYSKMIVRDVNNYIAQYTSGKLKLKGCFEIDKEFHKNPSMRIVPIALKEYFINNIPVKNTIINHNDIFDFCLRLKTNSKFFAEYHYIDKNSRSIKKLSKTTRYYISYSGGALYKRNEFDKLTGVNVGTMVQLFNKFIKKTIKEYDINYQFYISECSKIINSIEDNQLSLF